MIRTKNIFLEIREKELKLNQEKERYDKAQRDYDYFCK